MRLSTRLLLLILACLLPVLGTQFWAQYKLGQQHRQDAADFALHQAELANGDLASIAEGLRQLALAVAQVPAVQPAGPDCSRQLAAMQRHTEAVLFFAAFGRAGQELCSSQAAPLGRPGEEPDWLTGLLSNSTDEFGRYAMLPDGRGFLPFVVHPDDPDSPAAIIVAALDLRWLARHLAQIRVGPLQAGNGNALYIADRNGVVIARAPDAPQWIGRKLPDRLLDAIDRHRPNVSRISDGQGAERLVASIPADLPPTGLLAVRSLSLSAITPGLLQSTWRAMLPTFAASLLALALAWFAGRQMIGRPTGNLLSAARRWRDGDLGARAVPTRHGSEFADLADSFNSMAASLQAREQERRQHSEALEAQVAERTRALSESNNRLQVEIAEREKTEAALHQAHKLQAVGQLAGGIAHDFNNMLATVLGSLELMERRVAKSAEQWTAADAERLARLIERATGAVLRGSQLTSRLLAFSRRQRLAARPTDLNRLITDLVTLATPTLGRRVQLTTALAEDLWPALVDPSQVEAAILNCCLNARDAMPQGGQLTLSTGNEVIAPGGPPDDPAPGGYVRVSIADTGVGMDADVLRRAFDPFFTTKGPGGSGLGLSQVYGMVRQCGGVVRIASTPGQGTEVALLLPRAEQDAEAAAEPGAVEHEMPPTLVLLVDDDPAVRQVTAEMLKDLGCEVMQAPGGAEALDLLEAGRHAPELVLLDYAMPGMNGMELVRALRARGLRAPIAMATGYAELNDGDTEATPLDGLLRKPFSIRELEALIERLRPLGPAGAPPGRSSARTG